LLSPLYTALTLWVPADRAEVLKLACAPEEVEVSAALPRTVLPSWNVTVPVGVPLAVVVTVAVRGTAWPGAAGAAELASAVELPSCRTVWFRAEEVPLALVRSPP
jgi:hypothetical protein